MSAFPERILLATDGSEDAVRATEAASDLASKSGAELHVVHVWHDVPGFAHDFVKRELRRQGQEMLDEQVEKIRAAGGEVAKAHLRGGRTSNEIIALGRGDRRGAPGRRQPRAGHGAAHPDGQPVRGDRAPRPGPRPRAQGRTGVLAAGEGRRRRGLLRRRAQGGRARRRHRRALRGRRPARLLPPGPARVPPGRRGPRSGTSWTCASATRRCSKSGPTSLEETLGGRPEIRVSDGYPANVLLEASQRGAALARGRRQQGPGGDRAHQARERLDQSRDRRPRPGPGLSARRLGYRLQACRLQQKARCRCYPCLAPRLLQAHSSSPKPLSDESKSLTADSRWPAKVHLLPARRFS